MARDWIPSANIEKAIADVEQIAAALRNAAKLMNDNGVPHLLLHGSNYINTVIPTLLMWANRLEADTKGSIPSYLAGVPSSGERQVFQQRGEIPPRPDVPTPDKPKKTKKA